MEGFGTLFFVGWEFFDVHGFLRMLICKKGYKANFDFSVRGATFSFVTWRETKSFDLLFRVTFHLMFA